MAPQAPTVAAALLAALCAAAAVTAADPAFAPYITSGVKVSGVAVDLSTLLPNEVAGPNTNRLGGFGSDAFYDYATDTLYLLPDRGPGGGVISYKARFHKFKIALNPITGAITSFELKETILLRTPDGGYFNGLNPTLLNGNGNVLGLSIDPEGIVVLPDGTVIISDEYGPSIYAFTPEGVFSRNFTIPENVRPKAANGSYYYGGDGAVPVASGRVDNRGFEGLTITPDHKYLFAALQDPLVDEGERNSRYVRLFKFDIATGTCIAQYAYPLDLVSEINTRLQPGGATFSGSSQGRNIGLSAVLALDNSGKLAVLERDNRGFGAASDLLLGLTPAAQKRIYIVDTGATPPIPDGVKLAATLPAGVTALNKTLLVDLVKAYSDYESWLPNILLTSAAALVPEKIESMTLGPQLKDGTLPLLIITDNDFSVTQDGSNTQYNLVSNGTAVLQVALDQPIPAGYAILPNYGWAVRTAVGAVPYTPLFDFSNDTFYVPEGDKPGWSSAARVTVTRRGDASVAASVTVTFGRGTAKGSLYSRSGDYYRKAITLNFPAGVTSANAYIRISGNTRTTSDRYVTLALSSPSAGTQLGYKNPTARLVIVEDD